MICGGLCRAPPVAVFVHAVAGDGWRTLDPFRILRSPGYFRT